MTLLPRFLEADETQEAQKSLKIRVPKIVQTVVGTAWRPQASNFQVNHINRNYTKEIVDFGEFIWEFRTLPEGENSCLPELYDQRVFIPEEERNEAGDLGLYWFEYSVQKLSSLATEVREKINLDNKERRKRAKESPILTANNHLKLELFAQSDIAEKSYNKFTQPKVFRLEKDRKSLDDENRNWIKFGIFEDCKRLEQIFVQFPITDQVLFDNYMEISSDLQELKSARNDRHNLSKKLALAYDMIIIAKKVLPNKIQFVRREIESPDFGKLRIK